MSTVTVRVTPHWVNGWFLRLCSSAYLVVDGQHRRVAWGEAVSVVADEPRLTLGAGARYFGRGGLFGYVPIEIEVAPESSGATADLVLRNGFFNHTPFRLLARP